MTDLRTDCMNLIDLGLKLGHASLLFEKYVREHYLSENNVDSFIEESTKMCKACNEFDNYVIKVLVDMAKDGEKH